MGDKLKWELVIGCLGNTQKARRMGRGEGRHGHPRTPGHREHQQLKAGPRPMSLILSVS